MQNLHNPLIYNVGVAGLATLILEWESLNPSKAAPAGLPFLFVAALKNGIFHAPPKRKGRHLAMATLARLVGVAGFEPAALPTIVGMR